MNPFPLPAKEKKDEEKDSDSPFTNEYVLNMRMYHCKSLCCCYSH